MGNVSSKLTDFISKDGKIEQSLCTLTYALRLYAVTSIRSFHTRPFGDRVGGNCSTQTETTYSNAGMQVATIPHNFVERSRRKAFQDSTLSSATSPVHYARRVDYHHGYAMLLARQFGKIHDKFIDAREIRYLP